MMIGLRKVLRKKNIKKKDLWYIYIYKQIVGDIVTHKYCCVWKKQYKEKAKQRRVSFCGSLSLLWENGVVEEEGAVRASRGSVVECVDSLHG